MKQPSHRAQPLMAPDFPCPGKGGTAGLLPSGRASVSSAPSGNPTPVAIHGELDLVSGPQVRDRLGEALAASSGGLALDLSGLAFCDCAGLNVLLEIRHRALSQGKTVTIQAADPAIVRLLDLVGIQELFSSPRARCAEPPRREPVAPSSPKPGTPPGVDVRCARLPSPLVSEPA
ncbi:STAS domain-containing protein [Streptomyces populi]